MDKDPFLNLAEFGEEAACRFLRKNGCKILDRNFRMPFGEIDIIARSGKIVIFVEVKTRSSAAFAEPWEAVGFRKRERLKRAAKQYVRERILRDVEFRFDVVSIVLGESIQPQIEWIQAAF